MIQASFLQHLFRFRLCFFAFFSLPCSAGERQAGSSHLTVLVNPAADVNLICAIFGMVKIAMKSASFWGVYSSPTGEFGPSNPLSYISNYWKIQLQKLH